MKKLKAIINIIKTLKIALDEKNVIEIDKQLTKFYKSIGVL